MWQSASTVQDVRHAPFEQVKSPHAMTAVGVALQLPLLHCFTVVSLTAPELSHPTVLHAAPLLAEQLPLLQRSSVQPARLAVHSLSRSVPFWFVQVPKLPATLQLWHAPHMVCDLSQQTPSVQYCDPWHECSVFVASTVVHAPPAGIFPAQVPSGLQKFPAPQSASTLQPVQRLPSLLHTWLAPQATQVWPQWAVVLHVAQLLPLQNEPAMPGAPPGAHEAPVPPHSQLPPPHALA